jgi:ribokinase
VVVVGSINMDVVALAARHPALGETVLGSDLRFVPGGKGANQAVAAARLGAATRLIGRVGGDAFGESLVAFLGAEGIDIAGVARDVSAPTGTALIVVSGSDNTIVVVPGANAALAVGDLSLDPDDVVVAQCEIPLAVVEAAFHQARAVGARTLLNPAPALAEATQLLPLADVVVVNQTERAVFELPVRSGQVVVTTLGADGATAVVDGSAIHVGGRKVDAVDSTGAGDCFVGALAAALLRGDDVANALGFANAAASLSVQRVGAGTGMPTADMMADIWPPKR